MKNRQKYTQEFKDDAVSLVLSGRNERELARDLGIDRSNLNRWKRRYLAEKESRYNGQNPSEMEAENRRLRKQLAEQKEIVTILKKTIKYVS